jgi:hypothetical protein
MKFMFLYINNARFLTLFLVLERGGKNNGQSSHPSMKFYPFQDIDIVLVEIITCMYRVNTK